MKKLSFMASMAILANFGLVGCGGGSSAPTTASNNNGDSTSVVSVKGTAIDPELVNTTVCLDLNRDGNCNTGEPVTWTDENGAFSLDISEEQLLEDYPLLAIGGVDKATGDAFKGKLLADVDSLSQNITPLTTLTYTQLQNSVSQADISERKAQLETLLGLSFEEMQENIVTQANEGHAKALQVALTLQKSAEALMPENPLGFYDALAQQMETATPSTTFNELISSLTPSNLQADIHTFVEETMTTTLSDAHAMAEEAKEGAISRGLDFATRITEVQSENNFNSENNTSDNEERQSQVNLTEKTNDISTRPENSSEDITVNQPFISSTTTGSNSTEEEETPTTPTTPSTPTVPAIGF